MSAHRVTRSSAQRFGGSQYAPEDDANHGEAPDEAAVPVIHADLGNQDMPAGGGGQPPVLNVGAGAPARLPAPGGQVQVQVHQQAPLGQQPLLVHAPAPQNGATDAILDALERLIARAPQQPAQQAAVAPALPLPGHANKSRIPTQLMPSQVDLFDPETMNPEDFFRNLVTLLTAYGADDDQLLASFPVFLSQLPRVLWENMVSDSTSRPVDYPIGAA